MEEDNSELDELDALLRADIEESSTNKTYLHEVNIFDSTETPENNVLKENLSTESAVYRGDTDSSDDEEKRNFTEPKYSDCGTQIKKSLNSQEQEQLDQRIEFENRSPTNVDIKVARNASFTKKPSPATEKNYNFCVPETKKKSPEDVYTDPIFGIRITKPLITCALLLDLMQGREAVNMLSVKQYVENKALSKDWVIAGIIVRKSYSQESQKGNKFLIWTLSDLKDDLKTISLFLFGKAYTDLWKTSEGTVVTILNANVLDRPRNLFDQACLSVENSDRVMFLGQSKDFGICRSIKRDGERCTRFVNLSQCINCIYHVKQEYLKYSKVQAHQSSITGKRPVNLQNKVYGKSTFIYGGKAYAAVPTSTHKKVKDGDQMTNKVPTGSGAIKINNEILHSPTPQRLTDFQRLNNLPMTKTGISSTITSLAEKVANSPILGKGFSLKDSGVVDLNFLYSQRNAEKAKLNAIKLIQQEGGIKKQDPNNIKGTGTAKKRIVDELNHSSDENNVKKTKVFMEEIKELRPIMSERFKKIFEATSAHENLIKQQEDNEQEKYFDKLEKKEAMEEKMLNTFKLSCKAVRCVKCKYTSFSAAQICKDERHPLKILDTFKRFFKCADCNNRTVSLEILPLHSCSNCRGSRWEKAPMLREKKVTSLCEGLSIRGEEETFIGGQVGAGKNINLLIPDN